MSVKRTKRHIHVDLSDGAGSGEMQGIRDIFIGQQVRNVLFPLARRGYKHQEGSKKSRGSRMPALDAWIVNAVHRRPDATWKELWQRLDTENTDHDAVWIEGEDVKEWDGTKERSCRERNFRDRITAAKKARK